MSSSIYNLETIKTPRLTGLLLDIFTRLLTLPLIGRFILQFLKRKNRVQDVISFAEASHSISDGGELQPLMPLYYPIHEMSSEQSSMHESMVQEYPLDLAQIVFSMSTSSYTTSNTKFRHWTISDYTTRYTNKSITPSLVIERIISSIEEMDNKSIVTHMNVDELRKQAIESTKRYESGVIKGVLDGVPILVKDEIPVVGYPITHGTSFMEEHVTKDIHPIRRLIEEGALIVGKASQHEIGIGTTGYNLVNGTPKNPYGKDRKLHYYTGGSSSGSAAAVSLGLVPLSIGADGGGSIRIPASLCGCIGLKPTFKRIVMDGTMGCSVFSMGPMTNNVDDAALAYSIMAGQTNYDHRHQSQKQPLVHLHAYMKGDKSESKPLDGLRIGIFDEHINHAETNVIKSTRTAIEYYKSKGAIVVPIILPNLHEIHLAHAITITTEMFSTMENYYNSSHFYALSPETRVSLTIGKSWTASEFLASQKIRSFAMHHIEEMFKNKVDVILSPATPCVAPLFKKDAMRCGESNLAQTSALMRYVIHGNLTGIPAIVFPIGYDVETSLPISLQIQAAHWREDLLLHVAKQSEDILKNGIEKPALMPIY